MKVNVADQVSEYIKRLAPDSRKRLRRAIRLLEEEKGDIKALEDDLHGYYRVKVRSYRVIYAYRGTKRPGPRKSTSFSASTAPTCTKPSPPLP